MASTNKKTNTVRCRVCHRQLIDPFYANLGIGATCAKNLGYTITVPKVGKSINIVDEAIGVSRGKKHKKSKSIKFGKINAENPAQLKLPYTHEELMTELEKLIAIHRTCSEFIEADDMKALAKYMSKFKKYNTLSELKCILLCTDSVRKEDGIKIARDNVSDIYNEKFKKKA